MSSRHSPWLQQYRKQKQWFWEMGQWRGSVIPTILPKILICVVVSFGVVSLDIYGFNVAVPVKSGLIPSLVLGLLLVFRTNTAYDRFWEGRKAWGQLINTVRNLSRAIWICVIEDSPADRLAKQQMLHLLVAFAIAMKLHLRGEAINEELIPLMPADYYEHLQTMHHPPLTIAFWIGDYLEQQRRQQKINDYQLNAMFKHLDDMVACLGTCERILKTPIPAAYAIHLKQLVFLYGVTLPFEVVNDLRWLTPLLVGLISFAIFGIEEIGAEIENPFGYDANDLPLTQICQTMKKNIDDLMMGSPNRDIPRYSEDNDDSLA